MEKPGVCFIVERRMAVLDLFGRRRDPPFRVRDEFVEGISNPLEPPVHSADEAPVVAVFVGVPREHHGMAGLYHGIDKAEKLLPDFRIGGKISG